MARFGGCPSTGTSKGFAKKIRSVKFGISQRVKALNAKLSKHINYLLQESGQEIHLRRNFLKKGLVDVLGLNITEITLAIEPNLLKYIWMAVFAIAGLLPNNSNAGELMVYNRGPPISGSATHFKQIEGANENYDSKDAMFLSDPNPLQIYGNNSNCAPRNLLEIDARGAESTSDYNFDLENQGFPGSTQNFLTFRLVDDTNFNWKNMFLCDSQGSDEIVLDIKNSLNNSGLFIQGDPYFEYQLGELSGSETGVYDSRKIKFFNDCDLNRDRKVNFYDFAIFAKEWGNDSISHPERFGDYVGNDVNDLGAYADINRDGSVDNSDLVTMANEWGWNGTQ